DELVETGRRVVLDCRRTHDELPAVDRGRTEVPLVLRSRVIEVGEVPTVVDDALRIGVGEPDARERGVLVRRTPVGDPAELRSAADRASHESPRGPHLASRP